MPGNASLVLSILKDHHDHFVSLHDTPFEQHLDSFCRTAYGMLHHMHTNPPSWDDVQFNMVHLNEIREILALPEFHDSVSLRHWFMRHSNDEVNREINWFM